MFTLEEYKIIADVMDNANMCGTIHTLPPMLSKLVQIRTKLQEVITTMEYVPRESSPESAPPDNL